MALSHSKMASSTKTAIARITTFNSILIILLPIPSSDHAPAGILYAPPEHHSSMVRHIGGWRNLACYLKSVSNWRPCLPTDAGIHIITNLCYHSYPLAPARLPGGMKKAAYTLLTYKLLSNLYLFCCTYYQDQNLIMFYKIMFQ